MARSIESWVRVLDEDNIRWSFYDYLIPLHNELHEQYGDDPNDAIVPGEQRLAAALRSYGIEHRHKDALAEAAGTVIENPAPATLDEVRIYMERSITLLSRGLSVVQDAEGGPIYLKVGDSVLSDGLSKSVLKMVNKWMPPGVKLKAMPKVTKGEFAKVVPTHALQLVPAYAPREVEVWTALTTTIRESAAAATSVFKRDQDPTANMDIVQVNKNSTTIDGHDDWHYVLGEVLVPDEPDRTVANPDGTETGAAADVYDKVEVEKACHWFARNSQVFEFMHAAVGGHVLDRNEIQMAENFVQRGDWVVSDKRTVKSGTWMLGAYVRGSVREAVEGGELNGWSVSCSAMAQFEEAQAS
jgi:hypothetical protein